MYAFFKKDVYLRLFMKIYCKFADNFHKGFM